MRHTNVRRPAAYSNLVRFSAAEMGLPLSRDLCAYEQQDGDPVTLELLCYPLFYGTAAPSAELDNTYGRVLLELAVSKGAQGEPGIEQSCVTTYATTIGGPTVQVTTFSLPACGYRSVFVGKSARLRVVKCLAGVSANLTFQLAAAFTPVDEVPDRGLGVEALMLDGVNLPKSQIPPGAREARARCADINSGLGWYGPNFSKLGTVLDFWDWSMIPRAAHTVEITGTSGNPLNPNGRVELEFR